MRSAALPASAFPISLSIPKYNKNPESVQNIVLMGDIILRKKYDLALSGDVIPHSLFYF